MCTKEMPIAEVAYLVNEIVNLKLEPEGWRFGKRSYSRVDPPPMVLPLQLEANADFMPDQDASDMADPDLGAAALEDDATGDGGGAGGSGGRGGVEDWAPLSLERSTSVSVVRTAEGSTNNRRIDPAADLREAQERNAREVREEKEAAAKKAEANKAAAATAAQADADAAAKKQAEDAVRRRTPLLVTPLRSAPPAPEFSAPAGGAGDEQPIREREGSDAILPEMEAPPQPPTADAQGSQPAAPSGQSAGGELVVGSVPTIRTPVRRRVEKAASAPRPVEVVSASSSAQEAEATSAAPTEWVSGGGTSALIKAAQYVQADFKAEAAALSQCMKAFVKTRATVRDYHNIRAASFNANIRELDRRTADLTESRKANAALQQQLGEANTVLRAKEIECDKAVQECDRLKKELKDQAELHKTALKEAEANEAKLLAEFETERSDFFPGNSAIANQATEARREERRAGEVIDSSDEGEGEEDEDDEDGTPEVGADGQSQLDRAFTNLPDSPAAPLV
nr:enolase-phosphatase E1-like [Aegilops tauschii subsp. strangulata]